MSKESAISEILGTVKKQLLDLGQQVQRRDGCDLSLPVAIVDARKAKAKTSAPKFHVSPIVTIGNVLRISTTCDHPLLRKLFEQTFSVAGIETANALMERIHYRPTYSARRLAVALNGAPRQQTAKCTRWQSSSTWPIGRKVIRRRDISASKCKRVAQSPYTSHRTGVAAGSATLLL